MPTSRVRRHLASTLTFALTLSTLCLATGPAVAYDGAGAAKYADKYAIENNTPAYPIFGGDCTNFVSQAAHIGGKYPFRNAYTNASSDKSWWIKGAGTHNDDFRWANAWAAADGYYRFLIADNPGGHPAGTAPGSSTDYWTPDKVTAGDVLFYDWGQGEGVSHASMQVGHGVDPSSPGWKGNYVDQHTTNRYHAFWSLKPYNAAWATTTIYFMDIDAAN
ncbi:amidase domain-containing protein [Streptomyces griseoruber]